MTDPRRSQSLVMADTAPPIDSPNAPSTDSTIRVRVRQQEPAGEHDLRLPLDVRRVPFPVASSSFGFHTILNLVLCFIFPLTSGARRARL